MTDAPGSGFKVLAMGNMIDKDAARQALAEQDAEIAALTERFVPLVEENERLRAALDFYADPETYFAWGFIGDSPCGEWDDDFEETELGYKPGKRARAALSQPAATGEGV